MLKDIPMRTFVVGLIVVIVALTSCGQPTSAPPGSAQGAPVPRWLTFQIRQATVLRDLGDGLDGKAEFQIYAIATDGTTAAKLMYPAEGAVPVSAGQSIPLSKYALSIDERAIGDEIIIYVVAVDTDEQTSAEALATNVVADLLARAVLGLSTGGAGLVAPITLDLVAGHGTNILVDWARTADVIGQDTIILNRSEEWGTGLSTTRRTADGGLEITYQVYLGEKLPESLAWYPTPGVVVPVPTHAVSNPQDRQSDGFVSRALDGVANSVSRVGTVFARPTLTPTPTLPPLPTPLISHGGGSANAFAWSNHGKWVAVAREDSIDIVSTRDFHILNTLAVNARARTMAVSPDDHFLAVALKVGHNESVLQLRDTATWKSVQEFTDYSGAPSKSSKFIRFTPAGDLMIYQAGSFQQPYVALVDISNGTLIRRFNKYGFPVIDPSGRFLAMSALEPEGNVRYNGDHILVWDLAGNRQQLRVPVMMKNSNHWVSFSPGSRFLAISAIARGADVWDVVTGAKIHTLRDGDNDIGTVAFSPTENLLASSRARGSPVLLWDLDNGALLHKLTDCVTSRRTIAAQDYYISFSRDGELVAVGSTPPHKWAQVCVWQVHTGNLVARINGIRATSGTHVTFSPNREYLMTEQWLWYYPAQLWNIESRSLVIE